jgi:hypothetical protein
LNQNFNELFKDFDAKEKPRHFEKLTLVADGVGKDTISDFTTNLIHAYLAEITQEFARKNIKKERTKKFTIKKAVFDYETKVWTPKVYSLPVCDNDYVLLTPKDLLTRHDTWINKTDLIERFSEIPNAAPDAALRVQLSAYLSKKLREHSATKIDKKTKKAVLVVTKQTRINAARDTIAAFPETIDIYIRLKEKHGKRAIERGSVLVLETEEFFQGQFVNFAQKAGTLGPKPTSYEDAYDRAIYYKKCIEEHDCYLNLYVGDEPVDEGWIQRMFWFVWYGTESDVNRDPSNGLGKPDFAVSQGKRDKSLVEFKLAKSSSLEKNLLHQLEKYKTVNDAIGGIWVIVFFSATEERRVKTILKKLNLENNKNYILVDARRDNKTPPSKIK